MKSETWQQFMVEFSAPSGASSFYLEIRTYQNSIAYLDDFVFEENVTTSNPEEKFSEIKIYPNPASDFLIICNIFNLKHISIQNFSGTLVWSSDYYGEQNVTIPVSELANGIYIIRIITSNEIITRKFTKRRI